MVNRDPQSMASAAGRIGELADGFKSIRGNVTGVNGESPFGAMPASDGISGTVGSFTSGVQREFEAGERLLSELTEALRKAAGVHADTDANMADDLRVDRPRSA